MLCTGMQTLHHLTQWVVQRCKSARMLMLQALLGLH